MQWWNYFFYPNEYQSSMPMVQTSKSSLILFAIFPSRILQGQHFQSFYMQSSISSLENNTNPTSLHSTTFSTEQSSTPSTKAITHIDRFNLFILRRRMPSEYIFVRPRIVNDCSSVRPHTISTAYKSRLNYGTIIIISVFQCHFSNRILLNGIGLIGTGNLQNSCLKKICDIQQQ